MDSLSTHLVQLQRESGAVQSNIEGIIGALKGLSQAPLAGETEGDLAVARKQQELDEATLRLQELETATGGKTAHEVYDPSLSNDELRALYTQITAREAQKKKVDELRDALDQLSLQQKIAYDDWKNIFQLENDIIVQQGTGGVPTKEEQTTTRNALVEQWSAAKTELIGYTKQITETNTQIGLMSTCYEKSATATKSIFTNTTAINTETIKSGPTVRTQLESQARALERSSAAAQAQATATWSYLAALQAIAKLTE